MRRIAKAKSPLSERLAEIQAAVKWSMKFYHCDPATCSGMGKRENGCTACCCEQVMKAVCADCPIRCVPAYRAAGIACLVKVGLL